MLDTIRGALHDTSRHLSRAIKKIIFASFSTASLPPDKLYMPAPATIAPAPLLVYHRLRSPGGAPLCFFFRRLRDLSERGGGYIRGY